MFRFCLVFALHHPAAGNVDRPLLHVVDPGQALARAVGGVRNLAIGGTSIIIVVGVALETVKALEAQMLMRHYKGFLD